MGKIILEFDSFEEKTEAQNALDGGSWKALVNEFDQELRAVTKYGGSLLDTVAGERNAGCIRRPRLESRPPRRGFETPRRGSSSLSSVRCDSITSLRASSTGIWTVISLTRVLSGSSSQQRGQTRRSS